MIPFVDADSISQVFIDSIFILLTKAKQFVKTVEGNKSLYGYNKEDDTTLRSLLLTLLPTRKLNNWREDMDSEIVNEGTEKKNTSILLLECLLLVLKKQGFNFFQVCLITIL